MMLTYGLIKLSIVAFYRRIFVTRRGIIIDIVTKIAFILIILWTATFFSLTILGCGTHFSAIWGPTREEGEYCSVYNSSGLGIVISNFMLDLFILLLPLPFVSLHKLFVLLPYTDRWLDVGLESSYGNSEKGRCNCHSSPRRIVGILQDQLLNATYSLNIGPFGRPLRDW